MIFVMEENYFSAVSIDLKNLPDEEKAVLFDSIIDFLVSHQGQPDKNPPPPKQKTSSSSKLDYVEESSLTGTDGLLLSNLRKWKNEVAAALEVPGYYIFDNKTLISLAYYKPTSSEELAKIKGIGPEKLEKYGEDIINMIKVFLDQPPPAPRGRLMKC